MTEFVIEDIEKHRTSKKGEVEFYIKWEGYGPEENTWEVSSVFASARPGEAGRRRGFFS